MTTPPRRQDGAACWTPPQDACAANALPRRTFATLLGASVVVGAARANAFPRGPVRLVAPFPPGGAADSVARIAAEAVAPVLGQPVVVENRPGASGGIGLAEVARAPADGHTLGIGIAASLAILPHRQRTPGFDPTHDFAAVGLLGIGGSVLAVQPALGIGSLVAFARHAKALPAPLIYGSPGLASGGHLAMAVLARALGVEVQHAPYRGGAPLLQDFLAGHLAAAWLDLPTAVPHADSGRLVALAVNRTERSPLFPGAPTLLELGVPYDLDGWFGIVGPRGLSQDVLGVLGGAVRRAVQTPACIRRLAGIGVSARPSSAEEFAALIRRDLATAGTLVALAGLEPE